MLQLPLNFSPAEPAEVLPLPTYRMAREVRSVVADLSSVPVECRPDRLKAWASTLRRNLRRRRIEKPIVDREVASFITAVEAEIAAQRVKDFLFGADEMGGAG